MIKKEVNDLEKKYAFYAVGRKDVIELLKEQKIENIHVAELSRREEKIFLVMEVQNMKQ